jgi:hypothetical protein
MKPTIYIPSPLAKLLLRPIEDEPEATCWSHLGLF